jgi:beta-1,4-N-acetylglucosaminyltransferase
VIFVTVGTTHFDPLIQEIDELIAAGKIHDQVVCQIGAGKYIPIHAEHFRFQPSIDEWFDQADLTICHGGATVMSLLQKKKRFVAIANTELTGDHQTAFLSRLAQSIGFLWSRDVKALGSLIEAALNQPAPNIALPHLADELKYRV